ncbi:MAG: transcriptional regulator [Steroidobacterales bacterium]
MNAVAPLADSDSLPPQPEAERTRASAQQELNIPLPAPGAQRPRATMPKARAASSRNLHWPVTWALVVAAVIIVGAKAPLERYITPQRGTGYWLGIIGGSMMLLLLMYSARKRASWLRWMGGIPQWFQFHMVLGVMGPLLVLFHCNFSLGSTNSNVALICMLLVAGSGVVGRYIYTRIHANLDGNQDSLEDLQAVAEKIRSQTTKITFLPGLLDAIDQEQQRLVYRAKGPLGRFLYVVTAGTRAGLSRWRLHRLIRRTVAKAVVDESQDIARHAPGIAAAACNYADRRLDAGRRVAEYRLYARLFSFWHVLHIPLFFMLLIAAVAHVIAVNIY